MTINIKDLEMNVELDKEAMKNIFGGWKSMPANASRFFSPRKGSWVNTQQHALIRNSRKIHQM